jgi:hypothetical protein
VLGAIDLHSDREDSPKRCIMLLMPDASSDEEMKARRRSFYPDETRPKEDRRKGGWE